jgi:tyrosinase
VLNHFGSHAGPHGHCNWTFQDILANGPTLRDRATCTADYIVRDDRARLADRPITVRCDQRRMSDSAKSRFTSAVLYMCDHTDAYEKFTEIHSGQTDHMMHTPPKSPSVTPEYIAVCTARFLPWHRRFLRAFEDALQSADAAVSGPSQEPLGVPYWRMYDPFPDWLEGRKPIGVPSRNPNLGSTGVTPEEIRGIVATDFLGNRPAPLLSQLVDLALPARLASTWSYVTFSALLEGLPGFADDANIPKSHNYIHGWVGGEMSIPRTAVKDVVFWLLHAEVDRLWSIWGARNGNPRPPLRSEHARLTPWNETVDDVLLIDRLRYRYDDEQP